ncbi:unnamed protein product [Darwinula stevensoni]|uniref:Peptide transporter n=1 Tax=Darwinula stevensoni TaxID=69355 RepID=A0A7R9A4U9_9CRUS|nr:unnamed protein product [Darwinula stevensoni]CAG0894280.1 unnamed protein product [Darwinula stevensoni]
MSDEEKTKDSKDVEHSDEKKLPYPKAVFFIISNEFCERFGFYGMRTILVLYLKNVLGYDDDNATIIYHIFNMLCYFTPVIGAIISDTLLGKFRNKAALSDSSLFKNPPLNAPSSGGTSHGKPDQKGTSTYQVTAVIPEVVWTLISLPPGEAIVKT